MTTALRIRVSGLVQGVGYRPFVWRLARELDLAGWVRNDAAGVEIEAEGAQEQLDRLLERLRSEAPPLARVDSVRASAAEPAGTRGFDIARSGAGAADTAIGPDTAPCAACLEEILDPSARRWRHAFVTCTHCGPRFTLTRRLPYDRAHTSLADFPLCADCAREYADPADRRFHAEPLCCPNCGPRLAFEEGGAPVAGDPLAQALLRLRAGAIVAVKGVGGFHLACDARNAAAVARLRERKQREAKPFAVMGANLASLAAVARIGAAEAQLLSSAQRPVVLCPREGAAEPLPEAVAPGLAQLGLMLPASPLHVLLFHEAAGRPAGSAWLGQAQPLLLVMTSANPGGEPIVAGNGEARERLAGIADAWLLHDRDIVVRCDDSVRSARGFVRRARGHVPVPVALARPGPSVLALGGWYKSTACLTRGAQAYLGQHVGELDNAASCRFLEESVAHLVHTLEIAPAAYACDLHPDFHSTRLGERLAREHGRPLVRVQHHHAHVAAVLAEHGVEGPVLGLALDGVGLGLDGQAWGGELLCVDGARCERLAHLAPLRLPGGDRAAREPWRMAASALHALGRGSQIAARFAQRPEAGPLAGLIERGLHAPWTSSLGRVFDAASALLRVCEISRYEGEAAMRLEALAAGVAPGAAGLGPWRLGADGQLDLLPLLESLADETDARAGAARFHDTLAQALADWVARTARDAGLASVAAGGGCLLNARLAGPLGAALQARGLRFLEAREVPPNDGGLSLGQAWVAQRKLED